MTGDRTSPPSFVLLTAARDEGDHIGQTIDSVLRQTVKPRVWVVVDDGSTDTTPELVERARKRAPWIKLVRREHLQSRSRGPRIAEVLAEAYGAIRHERFDYACVVDADISFDAEFLEHLLRAMDADPGLGIAGPYVYERHGKTLRRIPQSPDTAPGALRAYRRECYEAIGGVDACWAWDAIDEIQASLLGWRTRTIEGLGVEHLKHQTLANKFEHGRCAYSMGSRLGHVVARSVWRLKDRPYVIGGMALLAGYLSSWARGDTRLDDPDLVAALRARQRGLVRATLVRSLFPERRAPEAMTKTGGPGRGTGL